MGIRETLGQLLVGDQLREAREAAIIAMNNTVLARETLAQLELAREDRGWIKMVGEEDGSLSRDYLGYIAKEARLYWLKNPLVKRMVEIQADYIFGQGITIEARHDAVNAVVQAFLDDPKNQAELTRHQARMAKEKQLQIEGNLFFVFFVGEQSGRVQVRSIRLQEVTDIITDPDDSLTPWFYLRTWQQRKPGSLTAEAKKAYYPDMRYRPKDKPPSIDNIPVVWDTPVYHAKVNCLSDMKFGVSEVWAAVDWAKAYKEFLENWATIIKSYSRFAWQLTTASAAGVAVAKAKIATTVGTDSAETNPRPVTGSVAIMPPGSTLEPMRTGGAQVAAADGRQLKLMVCAAMGIGEQYTGDPSTGNLATATAMERPMEFKFLDRRALWADIFRDILDYVIDCSVRAPQGPLEGKEVEGADEEMDIVLANDTENPDPELAAQPMDRTLEITFPQLLEKDMAVQMGALVSGATLGGQPLAGTLSLELITSIMLDILQVENKDSLMAELFPADAEGEIPPNVGGEGEGLEEGKI